MRLIPLRRRSVRYALVTSAVLTPIAVHAFAAPAQEYPHWVTVRNISLQGVGLESSSPLDVCSVYRIRCERGNEYLRSDRLRVISCRRAKDGTYEIGAELCEAGVDALAA